MRKENCNLLCQLRQTTALFNELDRMVSFESFESYISKDELKSIMFVVLTGSGDDYQAARAARALFEITSNGTGCGSVVEVQRSLYLSRYYDLQKGWRAQLPNRTLMAAISSCGSSDSVAEAVEKFAARKGETMAFTDDIGSALACSAKHTIPLCKLENFEDGDIKNYSISAFTAMLFGLYFSTAKGRLTAAQAQAHKSAAMRYINSFTGSVMKDIEKKAHDIAAEWKSCGVKYVDVVADGIEASCAQFGADRLIKSADMIAMLDDNEDWNHIPFWTKNPECVGTILFANSSSPSFSRSIENAEVYDAFSRKLVIITDTDDCSVFPESAQVFSMPKPEFRWMLPLTEHLPVDYIAAFLAENDVQIG